MDPRRGKFYRDVACCGEVITWIPCFLTYFHLLVQIEFNHAKRGLYESVHGNGSNNDHQGKFAHLSSVFLYGRHLEGKLFFWGRVIIGKRNSAVHFISCFCEKFLHDSFCYLRYVILPNIYTYIWSWKKCDQFLYFPLEDNGCCKIRKRNFPDHWGNILSN